MAGNSEWIKPLFLFVLLRLRLRRRCFLFLPFGLFCGAPSGFGEGAVSRTVSALSIDASDTAWERSSSAGAACSDSVKGPVGPTGGL